MLSGGIFFHAVGASGAALCYTPQKKLRGWSWQTYWLAQAVVCWLLLPVLVALITIPHLGQVLQDAPSSAMWQSLLLGMAYGIGGTAFGMAIRYVGFSITYAIAVGISCVLGTLLPPLMNGSMHTILQSDGAGFIEAGVILGAVCIGLCGLAGRSKEKDGEAEQSSTNFSLAKGLPLCLLAGVLSALYGFSLEKANPIADVASRYGAGNFRENVKYIFSNGGAFISTLIYCIYLHKKEKTFGEYSGNRGNGMNFLLAAITGFLWYGQFFFYGLGHVRMGNYKFTSWAIHMIMLVLFSAVTGLVLKEWKGAGTKAKQLLAAAIIGLIVAVILLTYGNYLGN